MSTFVSGQLTQFVDIEVERQLLRGASGGNEVQGLLTSRGVPVYAGTAAGDKSVQLFKAMNGTRGSAFVEPSFLVVHPSDYQDLRLLTDTAGQYFGGVPFQGRYGNGRVNQASGQITGAVDLIWGKPTYVTPIIGAGTALIGTSGGPGVAPRRDAIEFSNSHSDFFVKDLVAARAERRLALSVYRPSSVCEVRF